MLATWEYSLKTETERLLHCTHQIAVGFYKLNGFIVLPYPQPNPTDNIVVLPHLDYLSIPRFWSRSSRIDITTLPIIAPTDLVTTTTQLLSQARLPIPNYSHLQKIWTKHESQIIKLIYTLIPHKKSSISKIIINPTIFGTGCSFNRHRKPGDPIIMWLRFDQTFTTLVEAILSSLTRQDVYDQLGGVWQESEIIVDWLLKFSPLNNLLTKIDPLLDTTLTIKQARTKHNTKLIETSDLFLKSLGVPHISSSTIDTSAFAFTPTEKLLFDLLKSKSPKTATYDNIGDLLFKTNPETFSLEAIAKSIQRLRDKLESSGISGSYIQTKRGEGYMLIS